MKENKKTLKQMVKKPNISPKVKKHLIQFDLGANGKAHQYKRLSKDRYDAYDLLHELIQESNYDWQVTASQKHLMKVLKTNRTSLNFDLVSLDHLGLLHLDFEPLAKGEDRFNCKIIGKKVFD